MNVLMFTDGDQDYSADYLAHGFDALFPGCLIDSPRKPSLHLGDQPPVFDCDVDLPERGDQDVRMLLGDRACDLIVVPTLRGKVPLRLRELRPLLKRNQDRLVYYDGEDQALNTLPLFVEAASVEPAVYFKRELPIGETWAQPLPFGYPAERLVPVGTGREGAIYAVHIWPWAVGGLRDTLAQSLRGKRGVMVHTLPQGRLTLAEYHAANRKRLIAVSPAGQGYDTNRHRECIADGCCPVLEAPWREQPHAFVDGVHCRYFRNTMEAVDSVEELLADPAHALMLAHRAQDHFLAYHTTKCRAQTVWQAVHPS